MDWILPLVLTGCYSFYLHGVPWQREGRGWKLAATCLLTAAIWASYRIRSPIQWYFEVFLSYGILFFYLLAVRRLRAANCFYHVVILFLATDCILQGARHVSMVLWNADYLYDPPTPLSHLLFLAAIAALMLGILFPVRKIVFREKRQLVSAAQVFLMILTLLPILYLANIHQWLGVEPSLVGLDASIIRIILSLCGLVTILGNESMYRSRLQAQEIKSMEDRRIIQVKAAQENGFLVIRFENPYEHTLNRTDTGFDTTKTDRLGHGYGLKGIRYTVDKYQGHVVIDTDDAKFTLTLLLPCEPTIAD